MIKLNKKPLKKSSLKAVDFFCGGGGMSFGIKKAGIKILAGIDFELQCQATYEANIKDAEFINKDVFKLKEEWLENKLNLKKEDNDLVFIGCSPCQYWSIINTDKKKSEKSKSLLVEFKRFVKYFNPGYVVVENVPGVLRKKNESGLNQFIEWLKKNKYIVHFDIHNTNNYGVPQNRKRFTLIANRVTNVELKPRPKKGKIPVVKDYIGEENGFPKINAGHHDETDFKHSVPNITDLTLRRLKKVKKDGGNRLGFSKDSELQLDCFIGRDKSFQDTFGRLWWDKPSPTITTKFFSVSNGRFVHPEENRALSLREGAVLQSFPKSFKLKGDSMQSNARIIGNAVPPEYAKRIGLSIKQNHLNAIQD